MENKLTGKKLKTVIDFVFDIENYGLNVARDYFGEEAEQAHSQVIKMIENYDEVQAFAMEIIEGKRVTREWVESLILEVSRYFDTPDAEDIKRDCGKEIYEQVIKKLKTRGVEVTDGE